MAKAKVKQRKDSKGRKFFKKGESQRKLDGMYIYTYVNPYGKNVVMYIPKIPLHYERKNKS